MTQGGDDHFLASSEPTGDEMSADEAEAEAAQRSDKRLAKSKRRREELSADNLDALARQHVEERVVEAKRPKAGRDTRPARRRS